MGNEAETLSRREWLAVVTLLSVLTATMALLMAENGVGWWSPVVAVGLIGAGFLVSLFIMIRIIK